MRLLQSSIPAPEFLAVWRSSRCEIPCDVGVLDRRRCRRTACTTKRHAARAAAGSAPEYGGDNQHPQITRREPDDDDTSGARRHANPFSCKEISRITRSNQSTAITHDVTKAPPRACRTAPTHPEPMPTAATSRPFPIPLRRYRRLGELRSGRSRLKGIGRRTWRFNKKMSP